MEAARHSLSVSGRARAAALATKALSVVGASDTAHASSPKAKGEYVGAPKPLDSEGERLHSLQLKLLDGPTSSVGRCRLTLSNPS